MIDKIDPEVKEILEQLDSLTEDQLATAHLLLAHYIQLQFVMVPKKMRSSLLYLYLKSVGVFIKQTRLQLDKKMLPHYGVLATYELNNTLKDALSCAPSHRAVYNGILLLRIVKGVLADYPKVFGDKSFTEYFDDLSFKEGRIFSRKASNMIMYPLYEEELKIEDAAEDESQSNLVALLEYYVKHWNSVQIYIETLPKARSLVFHGVSLLLCRMFLPLREYVKYRKHIGRCIKDYIGTEGIKIKRSSEVYLQREALPRIKTLIFSHIDQGYDQEDELAHRFEWLTLATDLLLTDTRKLDTTEAHQILLQLHKDKEDTYSSDKFEEYAQTYLKAGKEEYEKLRAGFGIAKTAGEKTKENGSTSSDFDFGSDFDCRQPSIVEGQEGSLKEIGFTVIVDEAQLDEGLKRITKILRKLDISPSLMFHALVIGILMEREVPQQMYEAYKKAVNQAILISKRKKEDATIQAEIKKANDEFKKFFRSLNKTLKSDELKKYPYRLLAQLVTANSISQCLEDIPRINPEIVSCFLTELEYYGKPDVYKSYSEQAYLLKYLVRGEKFVKQTYLDGSPGKDGI